MPDETLRGPDGPSRTRDPRPRSSRPGDRTRSGDRVRPGGGARSGTARSGTTPSGRAPSASPATRPRRVPARHFGRLMLLAMALVIVAGFVVGMLLPVT
jgi:hypothetical protein